MEIKYRASLDPKDQKIIVPVFSDKTDKGPFPAFDFWLKERIDFEEFSATSGEILDYYFGKQHYLLLGLGSFKELDPARLRSALASAVRHLRSKKISEAVLFLPKSLKNFFQETAEGIVLGNYSLALCQTGSSKKSSAEKIISKLFVVGELSPKNKISFEKGIKIAETVNYVRDLVNLPHNYVDVNYLAEEVRKIGHKNHYKVTIFDRPKLEKMGFGALLSVNHGSYHGAKLAMLEYFPLSRKNPPIALIGKGVTFDTGGLNLKPSSGIDWMKMDMAGSAVVLGVFSLLKELKIKKNVVAVLPITDNAVDATATKPNDIVTSYSGKTIEVLNTDAEGRLILADAISYAIKQYRPGRIIDLATLTGACMVALGEQQAGLFGNNEQLIKALQKSAENTDEEVWHMPIHEFHRKELIGTFSDLTNLGNTGYGGACIAAAFLENFVEKTPWVHLDIAGTAKCKKNKDLNPAGSATGYGVRLLVDYLENVK